MNAFSANGGSPHSDPMVSSPCEAHSVVSHPLASDDVLLKRRQVSHGPWEVSEDHDKIVLSFFLNTLKDSF